MSGKKVTEWSGSEAFRSGTTAGDTGTFRSRLGDWQNLRSAIVHGGINGAQMRGLRTELSLTLGDVAHILGSSERSVMRKEKSTAALSVTEADRAYRLARVADLALEILGDEEKAKSWLKSSHPYLGGESPINVLNTEIGTDLVMQSLYAIAYGGVG
jgi:putative toxin-antitoxin system antitoxin component (TIGR02293 family)